MDYLLDCFVCVAVYTMHLYICYCSMKLSCCPDRETACCRTLLLLLLLSQMTGQRL